MPLYINPNKSTVNVVGPCGENYIIAPFTLTKNRRQLRQSLRKVALSAPEGMFDYAVDSKMLVLFDNSLDIPKKNIAVFDEPRLDLAKSREERVRAIRDAQKAEPERAKKSKQVNQMLRDANLRAVPEDAEDALDDDDVIAEIKDKKVKTAGKKKPKATSDKKKSSSSKKGKKKTAPVEEETEELTEDDAEFDEEEVVVASTGDEEELPTTRSRRRRRRR